jgi:cytochrome P450
MSAGMQIESGVQRQANDILTQLMTSGEVNPYPLYGWLRENAPLFYSEQVGAYILSRYADCVRVLKDYRTFRSVDQSVVAEMFPQAMVHEAYRLLLTAIIAQNPPTHTRLRRLVSREFTPRRVEGMRPEIERICDELLDGVAAQMRDGAVVDLHSTVSMPLPLRVLAELLGVPRDDLPRVSTLVPRMLHVVDPAATPAEIQEASAAFKEFGDYLEEMIAIRRRTPSDDLISALVTARETDEDQLSDNELQTMLFALWAAGFETPAIALDNGVLTLLREPQHVDRLADRDGAQDFIDELFRWETPGSISTSRRYATEAVDFGGYRLPEGAQVRLLLNAANRDPDAYPDPDRFDPGRIRTAPTSLAFGAGIHFCLGSGLARLEITILLRKLTERLPGLRLAGEPVRRRSIPLRDFSSFNVYLDK